MANLNNHITSFIKVTALTTLLFGGLVAQSYATNVISDSLFMAQVEDKELKNPVDQPTQIVIQINVS